MGRFFGWLLLLTLYIGVHSEPVPLRFDAPREPENQVDDELESQQFPEESDKDGSELRSPCPAGFQFNVAGSPKCYQVVTDKQNWDSAQANCRRLHPTAHLAIINDALQGQIVSQLLRRYNKSCQCAWIGFKRIKEGDCKSPFVWKPDGYTVLPVTYSNWYPGQPDCHGGKESCAVIRFRWNMQWNDFTCGVQTCSVCETLKL